MEPIFFYFKETPVGVDNKFTLDFSNNELIYQINFTTENDYYITTMNCNLVIANDYGGLLGNIKKLLIKSQLLLEKGAAYQFYLSLAGLAVSFPGMNKKKDKLNLLSDQYNIDLFSCKYKFYDVTENQIKDYKFFSPYTQFFKKGFEFEDTKKTRKYRFVTDDQNNNIVSSINWKWYLFDFDSHYLNQNLIFA